MEQDQIKFTNQLIKQGNSFCIRIPSYVIKQLNIKESDFLVVRLNNLSLKLTEDHLSHFKKEIEKCKQLKIFEEDKLNILATISFNESKLMINKLNNKFPNTAKEQVKGLQIINGYREKLKKDFGEKLFNEYLKFRKIFDRWMQKPR